ncbi:SsgA family sporulation/cell division regulator [Blastococcus sp. TML/M2B]|uniref:SsgA family sporulation/cell division regulator n=1 Tax=Blastococcus sp. TML/M2B TaxID=2798727 RepID=UPI001F5B05CD|nr:SsgA family sporulation/cell division regulator [Blastococcus sp. TML/M2B]
MTSASGPRTRPATCSSCTCAPPRGEALFELSRAVVASFLRQTEALVPSGSESELLRLDDELHVLLSNGGADPTGR